MYQFQRSFFHSLASELPPFIVSSEDIEMRLAEFYQRLKLPFGRLELMTGIKERRFWSEHFRPSQGAILAGEKSLEKCEVSRNQIEALVYCSVSRDFLEPATASVVHKGLSLPANCLIFDISNACLGFLNGIIVIAQLIEAGQIKNGLVVSCESGGPLVEQTIRKIINDKNMTRSTFKNCFASLTIGSGAVACVVSAMNQAMRGYVLKGANVLADTNWVNLCQGDAKSKENLSGSGFDGGELPDMNTDSETMLHAGINLAYENWQGFKAHLNWENDTPDFFVCHQVGKAHQNLLFQKLGLDINKDHPTYSKFGNTGSAALPMALCDLQEENKIKNTHRLALLGIGSGLNSIMIGVEAKLL